MRIGGHGRRLGSPTIGAASAPNGLGVGIRRRRRSSLRSELFLQPASAFSERPAERRDDADQIELADERLKDCRRAGPSGDRSQVAVTDGRQRYEREVHVRRG